MSKKRKYQLPHYDRIHPMTRNAMDIAMIAGEIKQLASKVGAEKPEDVILMLENGGYEVFFDPFVNLGPELQRHYGGKYDARQRWEEAYDYCGEHIGTMQEALYREFIDLGGVPPEIVKNPTTKAFAYAEAVAAHQYDRYGRQAFSIMPMMAEMFENTDLGDLTLADVHLPYDCFYVMLEESKIPLLDGFYVHHRKDVPGDVLAFVGFGFSCDPDHVNEVWPNSLLTKNMTEKEYRDRDGYFRYHFEIQLNRSKGTRPKQWGTDHPRPTRPLWTGVPLTEVIDRIHEHPDLKFGLDTARGFAGLGLSDAASPTEYARSVNSVHRVDELSRYMVKMAMSLLLYLNSDEKSTVVTTEREEVEQAEKEIAAGKKGRKWGRKGKKARAAKERRKFLSTARVSRVGEKETAAITSRPGFSFEQPRHWRKGHFHKYWTGPVKENGERIPYEDWEEKRTTRLPWVMPTLINKDAKLEVVTRRTVVHHEDEFAWMDELIEKSMEGGSKEVSQSQIERDPRNRKICIEAHGAHCFLCGKDGGWMDDDMRLNSKGLPSAWLHCHHVEPLGEAGPRETDPVKDMVPMCAECHTMMHLRPTALTLEEGMEFLNRRLAYEKQRKASSE